MRSILRIAPLVQPLSATAPGGAEQGVITLARYQQEKGYKVQVVATKESAVEGVSLLDLGIPGGKLVPVETSLGVESKDFSDRRVAHILSVEEEIFSSVKRYIVDNAGSIGLIHNHAYDMYPLFELNDLGIPILHKLHLPPFIPWINDRFKLHKLIPKWVKYVTCSKSCASNYRSVTGFEPSVVYNGVNLSAVPYLSSSEDHFLWVGRISREKGLHTAIQAVSKERGRKLVIIGRIYDEEYFDKFITPHLNDPNLDYRGPLPHSKVLEEMGRAKALIMPLEWDEPFGWVFAESLAAGTPVIAYKRGAVSEIVEHGVTGFLVNDYKQLVKSLDKVHEINRKRCRESVADVFSVENMVEGYQREYEDLIRTTIALANV